MNRSAIIFICIILALLGLSQPIVIDTMLAFFVLGIIPGTDTTIPFWITFLGFIVSGIVAISWLSTQPLYIGSIPTQEQTARKLARKRITPATKKELPARRTRRQLHVTKLVS